VFALKARSRDQIFDRWPRSFTSQGYSGALWHCRWEHGQLHL